MKFQIEDFEQYKQLQEAQRYKAIGKLPNKYGRKVTNLLELDRDGKATLVCECPSRRQARAKRKEMGIERKSRLVTVEQLEY